MSFQQQIFETHQAPVSNWVGIKSKMTNDNNLHFNTHIQPSKNSMNQPMGEFSSTASRVEEKNNNMFSSNV